MKGPVFIVGCQRSGTTLLRAMLIQGTLHIPPETGFLPVLRRRRERYGDLGQPQQRRALIADLGRTSATSRTIAFDAFELDETEAHRAVGGAAPTNYAGAIRALYEASARKRGKTRWGDKTPRYVLEMAWLARAFPDARFVHMIRDGRAVALSMAKAGWFSRIDDAANRWVEYIRTGRRIGRELGPSKYRELRYEVLVAEPETRLRDLCRWLDLDYSPAMLQFHRDSVRHIPSAHRHLFELIDRPIDASRADAWKQEMSPRQRADFEHVGSRLLVTLGYERAAASVPQNTETLSEAGA